MSYVIQNFNDYNKKINLTPRFKFFFLLNNLEKFFFFFKINTFLNLSTKLNLNQINNFNIFFKYFFSKQFIKFFFQLNLNLVGQYTNNLTKSSLFNIFYNFNKFFNLNKTFYLKIYYPSHLIFNIYFLPIKTLNIRINNTFYKNVFFYFMLSNSFIWYQYSSNLRFYLNYIFVNYTLKSFRFYNGHFLRIYNY
jgi:hypothetical protein